MKFENDLFKVQIEKKQLSEEQKTVRKLKWKKRWPAVTVALVLVIAIIGVTVYSHFYAPKSENIQANAAVSQEMTVAEQIKEEQIPAGQSGDMGTLADDENEAATEEGAGSDEAGEKPDEDTWEEWDDFELEEGEFVASSRLAASIQEKYAGESLYGYTYGEPIEGIGRTDSMEFQLGYDPYGLGIEYWTEIYALYEDPELTQRLGSTFFYDEETKTLTLSAPETGVPCLITTSSLDVETVNRYPHNIYYLYDKGDGTSWGNLGTAYLACYKDRETGETLDEPVVSIITFKGEIEEAPKLTYSITEDGRPEFSWNAVEGAEEYMVCRTDRTEESGYGSLRVLGITSETTWTTAPAEFDSWTTTNNNFKTYQVSEDDWKDEYGTDRYLETYGEDAVGKPQYPTGEYTSEYGICVIAVNQEGCSMISNVYDNEELASNLPYAPASNAEKENGVYHYTDAYTKVDELPTYDYVTMCDGYTVTKLIDYQTEKAYIQNNRYIYVDEETGEYVRGETLPCLNIPYHVQGTPFYYEFSIADYDEANLKEDMAFLEQREADLSKKSGTVAPEFSLQFATHEDLKPKKIRQVKSEIFASTALSEYLATNMLGGAEVIDLRDFPEAKDKNMVDDAFLEAYYQNPLILGISGYRISKKGTAIRIAYDETAETQAEKQQEIQEKVEEIIAEIITDDMTDREKELAINQYLCENIVYDEDALENAEENDFVNVDDKFNDSFTAYGALIDGKCVCAGYAAAFKLLAEAAGLECIVVTGFLDGSLAHAWNKVKIGEEWQIVDSTNNDNEYIVNALFNLPGFVGDRILVEDKAYLLDKKISEYTGESEENEYYHITNSYFPTKEIGRELAEDLREDGVARLRTDYALNDSEFYDITDVIYDILGEDIDLYGYHWLGVIYLELE